MWHSDKQYTKEEIEIIRELEYDLFMYNPGFRSMWNNDFELYFKALFDERLWQEMEQKRHGKFHNNMEVRMINDPEFAEFMKEQSIIDSVLFGDMKIEHAPFGLQQEIRNIIKGSEDLNKDFELREKLGLPFNLTNEEDEEEKDNPLYKDAKDWGMQLMNISGPLYEQTKDINLFRILKNCTMVASKIVGAGSVDYESMGEDSFDFAWRVDRNDYNLSLTSLKRCMESLEKISSNKNLAAKINYNKFLTQAKAIRTNLIDLLDSIEQERFKNRLWK